MAIKMLIFDYRETEYDFFGKNKFDNYEIKFFDFSLNEDTICQISEEDKQNTIIISTFIWPRMMKLNGFLLPFHLLSIIIINRIKRCST